MGLLPPCKGFSLGPVFTQHLVIVLYQPRSVLGKVFSGSYHLVFSSGELGDYLALGCAQEVKTY